MSYQLRAYRPDGTYWVRALWDDTARTVTTYDAQGQVTSTRPYTEVENAAADAAQEADARLVSENRLARLEAKLWPAEPDPTDTTGVPTWAELGGIAPAGALVLDGGKVWRNVSGVPLATPPSGFPGWTEAQLAHLWQVVLGEPDPGPEPSEWPQWRGEWSAEATYKVGDHASRGGLIYRCITPHGPEYQGTWGPPSTGVWALA